MAHSIDLRSDTVTQPTPAMRQAMYQAEVGDDVLGEDPTVRRLEELGAAMTGKEAGLFVVSGTMGNQVAVLTHTRRGDEVICEADAHIYLMEVGGMAALSGAQARPLHGRRGILSAAQIDEAIRGENIHFPHTALICLENTHNRASGTYYTPDDLAAIYHVARERRVAVHMDGARLFNAAVAQNLDARQLTKYADSVMFCLSKGLCAPVGSLLVGSREFIARARQNRKMVGGGMRQAGIIAAAGIVALETMVARLAEDHANARLLAEGLANVPKIQLDVSAVQTNIVIFNVAATGSDAATFVARLAEAGVQASSFGQRDVRLVTHYGISRDDIRYTVETVNKICQG